MVSKKTLSMRIKKGRMMAKSAKPTKAVLSRARKAGVKKSELYYKAGSFHVPNKKKDSAVKAKMKLKGKTYSAKSGDEWRGDHNRRRGL